MPFTASRPRLHYVRDGTGPPIVLSHALGCSMAMWDDVARALAGRFTVIRYDTRGHGDSEVVTGAFSLADLVSDARRLIDELSHGHVSWVGLSLGGVIGQGLAIEHPDRAAKLVLANTVSRYPEDGRRQWLERARVARTEGMPALAELIMSRYFSAEFRQTRRDVVEQFRGRVSDLDPAGYAACCEAVASLDYHSQLQRIACPTLVIAGGRDVTATAATATEIAARIPGATFSLIADAGHLSAVERPDAFAELVGAFLER